MEHIAEGIAAPQGLSSLAQRGSAE